MDTCSPSIYTVFISGHVVTVHDWQPQNLKIDIPLVIIPGWMEVPESHSQVADFLAEQGRRIIAFDTPHGLPLTVKPQKGGWRIMLQKMETIIQGLQAMGIKRVDMMGRSEGAIVASLAARCHPEIVRYVVLENPAGMIGKDNLFSFLRRWLQDQQQTRDNEEHDPPPYAPVPIDTVIKRNPWRAFVAILAIIYSDMRPVLKYALKKGVRFGVVTTLNDRLFPSGRIFESIGWFYSGHHLLGGSHTSYFSHPEQFADAIEEMLRELERLQAP